MKYRSNYIRPVKHGKPIDDVKILDAVLDHAIYLKSRLKFRDMKKEALPQAIYDILSMVDRQSVKWACLAWLQDNYEKELEYAIHQTDLHQEVRERKGKEGLAFFPSPAGLEDAEIPGTSAQMPQRRSSDHGQGSSGIHLGKNKIK